MVICGVAIPSIASDLIAASAYGLSAIGLFDQDVGGIPSATFQPRQHAPGQQVVDVAQRRVG